MTRWYEHPRFRRQIMALPYLPWSSWLCHWDGVVVFFFYRQILKWCFQEVFFGGIIAPKTTDSPGKLWDFPMKSHELPLNNTTKNHMKQRVSLFLGKKWWINLYLGSSCQLPRHHGGALPGEVGSGFPKRCRKHRRESWKRCGKDVENISEVPSWNPCFTLFPLFDIF